MFSDPVVLESMRNELSMGIRQEHDDGCIIDLTHVKSFCPILLSTFMEIMCVYPVSTATRIAMEDYRLKNQYLFKKGSITMMPSAVQHMNRPVVWVDTVDEINHARHKPGTNAAALLPSVDLAEEGRGDPSGILHPLRYPSQFYCHRFDFYPVDYKWILRESRR